MSNCRQFGNNVAGAGSNNFGSNSKVNSILAILRNVSLGQTITVGTDSGNFTGRFAGIENGNVLLTTTTGALVFIPLRQINFISIP
jgi:hypothetical protein